MQLRHPLVPALTLLETVGAAMATITATAHGARADDLSAFVVNWLDLEDRTGGRAIEDRAALGTTSRSASRTSCRRTGT